MTLTKINNVVGGVITCTVLLLLLPGGCKGLWTRQGTHAPLMQMHAYQTFPSLQLGCCLQSKNLWTETNSCDYWCNGCIETHLSNEKSPHLYWVMFWTSAFSFYIYYIYLYMSILFLQRLVFGKIHHQGRGKIYTIVKYFDIYLTALGIALETELRETQKD
jgi:hypothetical protein